MRDLKILFVGVGSIAKRHITNIKEFLEDENTSFTIDALRSSSRNLDFDYIDNQYFDVDDINKNYDAIFITNPTKFHYSTLQLLNNYSNNFFIEKPLVDISDVDNLIEVSPDKTYYVACPIRHSAIIKYLKENLDLNKVNGVRCICSTYLPSWHPDEDYRQSYSAKKELGGGVSIDLIHEWDYLSYLFGKPIEIFSILDKKSDLEINSEDSAIYIASYDDYLLELHLDYFGTFPIREIMIFTSEDTIIADIQNNKLIFKNEDCVIDFSQERNDYQLEELRYFFDLIENKKENINDIENALDVLKLTQGELR